MFQYGLVFLGPRGCFFELELWLVFQDESGLIGEGDFALVCRDFFQL